MTAGFHQIEFSLSFVLFLIAVVFTVFAVLVLAFVGITYFGLHYSLDTLYKDGLLQNYLLTKANKAKADEEAVAQAVKSSMSKAEAFLGTLFGNVFLGPLQYAIGHGEKRESLESRIAILLPPEFGVTTEINPNNQGSTLTYSDFLPQSHPCLDHNARRHLVCPLIGIATVTVNLPLGLNFNFQIRNLYTPNALDFSVRNAVTPIVTIQQGFRGVTGGGGGGSSGFQPDQQYNPPPQSWCPIENISVTVNNENFSRNCRDILNSSFGDLPEDVRDALTRELRTQCMGGIPAPCTSDLDPAPDRKCYCSSMGD